ncbi:hypothetical protein AB0K52_24580 [Glycomyces sp. NPDC049804]|uniref:hypothetical protein n=1 Tax=Glycomyces sp. NPDC049804 TaxID=3154363 RepID=UPI003448D7C8
MNRVEFIVAPDGSTCLDIKVDGVRLQELARRVELACATDEEEAEIAGGYDGLTPLHEVCWPSRHFLGEPALSATDDGDTVLLGCDCGLWGCWPLVARVEVAAATVTWRDFKNPYREAWDLSGIGPFEFQRAQYEASLRATEQV